jgi:hypothetical protein
LRSADGGVAKDSVDQGGVPMGRSVSMREDIDTLLNRVFQARRSVATTSTSRRVDRIRPGSATDTAATGPVLNGYVGVAFRTVLVGIGIRAKEK